MFQEIESINITTAFNNQTGLRINNQTLLYTENELKLISTTHYYVYELLGAIIFTLGIIFNLLSFTYFQLSRSFKDTSMRYYLSVISITDSLRLIEWPVIILVDKQYIHLSGNLCRVLLFITTVSGLISIWLLAVLSIERYIILQFPFRGKVFYKTRTSIKILILMVLLPIAINIPYFLPNVIRNTYSNYEISLYMCNINPKYHIFMFITTIVLYSVIPFMILFVFNCLLICLLAKQKRRQLILFMLPNTTNANLKQERKFKEKTILLIIVSFFLIFTLSPRYIVQMLLWFTQHQNLTIIAITKCLIILEMFNFSFNFFFYILCSKTSRYELYLIFYYLFYWRWSKKSKVCYCNNCMQLLQQQQQNGVENHHQQQQQHQHSQYTSNSIKSNGSISSNMNKASFSAINSQYQYIKRLSQQSTHKILPPIHSSTEEEPLKQQQQHEVCVQLNGNGSNKKIMKRFDFIHFRNQSKQAIKRNKYRSSSLNVKYDNNNNNNNNNNDHDYGQINQSTTHIHHNNEPKLQTFLMRHSSLSSRFPFRHASLKY